MATAGGEYDHLLKLILIGDSNVGKSALLTRFVDKVFDAESQPTIGVDFKVSMMRVASKLCKVTIWDTAGQERFRTLTSTYYRGAHAVILVYDITRAETFRQLGDWLRELELYCTNGGRDVVKVLVGNKSDKEDERAVSTREAEAWARSRGMLFLEASARSEKNVQQVFEEAVQKVLEDPSLVAGTKPGAAPRATVRMDAPAPPATENTGSGCCGS